MPDAITLLTEIRSALQAQVQWQQQQSAKAETHAQKQQSGKEESSHKQSIAGAKDFIHDTIASHLPAPIRNLFSAGRNIGRLSNASQTLTNAARLARSASSGAEAGAGASAAASSGAAAGGGAEAAGAGLLAIPGLGEAIAAVAIGFIALKAVLHDIPVAIYNWGQSLLDSQRIVAQYSPTLAGVFLQFQARQMLQERSFGEQTAGSTGGLAASMTNINETLVPIRALITDIKNVVASKLIDLLNAVLTPLEWLASHFGYKGSTGETGTIDLMRRGSEYVDAYLFTTREKVRRRGMFGQDNFQGRP